MSDPLSIRRETFIAAPPAAVFAYLTDPEKIVGWMGSQADIDPQVGGLYLLKGVGRGKATARGAFREVVPVHRLAYSFGWDGLDAAPPGSTLIEFDLIDQDGGTLLRMTHSGLASAELRENHSRGWAHYLGRLATIAAGRDPGPDPGPEGDRA
jgi:uncharacterized protein YndB with AHSA1/START domain